MNPSSSLQVVLGAGQIGQRVAQLLLAQGHRVRLVRRGAPGPAQQRLEWAQGDVADLAFAEQVSAGARVVYDCTNPAYHLWAEQLMPLARGSLHAARHAGARLVALDCLYAYGKPSERMREDTVQAPVTPKGVLRRDQSELRLQALARGDVEVAMGRASDFFGPDVPTSFWGPRFFDRVASGKSAQFVGELDLPHAYTYAPDVAAALVTLGEHEGAVGGIWHLPTEEALSTRQVATRVGEAMGRRVTCSRMPGALLAAVGLFSPMLREVAKMAYQWEVPFLVDDSKFRRTFSATPTPWAEQFARTARWALAREAA